MATERQQRLMSAEQPQSKGTVKRAFNATSALLGRLANFGANSNLLGTLFNGARNLYKVFGYATHVGFEEMFAKYARQDIATRVVEAEPNAIWANPPKIEPVDNDPAPMSETAESLAETGDSGRNSPDPSRNSPDSAETSANPASSDGDTPDSAPISEVSPQFQAFLTAWDKLVVEQEVFTTLNRLDKLAGLGAYSILVIGLNDGRDISQPVNPSRSKEVIYLQTFGETSASIKSFVEDTRDPRYGKPLLYTLNPQRRNAHAPVGLGATFNARQTDVHYSRVIHVAEGGLESDVYGIPRMMRAYNLLDDILKTAGGSAETFWLTANRGMQLDVDAETELKPEDAEALAQEVDEYHDNIRRVLRTRGVKITPLGSDVADPSGTFSTLIALLSAATGIPQRILLGAEAGQLASAQDRANWANRVAERRFLFAEPVILRPFIQTLIDANALPDPGDDFKFDWPDAFIQNPLERAMTAAQMARAMANLAKAFGDGTAPLWPFEARNWIGLSGSGPKINMDQETTEGSGRNSDNDSSVVETREEREMDEGNSSNRDE